MPFSNKELNYEYYSDTSDSDSYVDDGESYQPNDSDEYDSDHEIHDEDKRINKLQNDMTFCIHNICNNRGLDISLKYVERIVKNKLCMCNGQYIGIRSRYCYCSESKNDDTCKHADVYGNSIGLPGYTIFKHNACNKYYIGRNILQQRVCVRDNEVIGRATKHTYKNRELDDISEFLVDMMENWYFKIPEVVALEPFFDICLPMT